MLLKMADLRQKLEDSGFSSVKTLLQSGNVVVASHHKNSDEVATQVSDLLKSHFGMSPRVIVLSGKQWTESEQENPFPKESEAVGKWVQIYFGSDELQRTSVNEFAKTYSGPEVIEATQNAIYVYFPVGIGESALFRDKQWGKLTAQLTARNWNTVQKISAELEG